jgi:FkbM family methyltransferase
MTLLVPNPLFSARWYLALYPDVAGYRLGAYRHFRRFGAAEGRNPNAVFDTRWYLTRYPDVASSSLNPLDHYLRHGAGEGRDPGPGFSTITYLRQNPDVEADGMNPLLHYLRMGHKEGREPSPSFALMHARPIGDSFARRASMDDVEYTFRLLLDRPLGPDGQALYADAIRAGLSLDQLLRGVLDSSEYRESRDPAREVVTAYRVILGTEPDEAIVSHYASLLRVGLPLEHLGQALMHSPQFASRREAMEAVQSRYIDGRYLFARLSDTYIGRAILEGQGYEPHVTGRLADTLRTGQTFLDIGANIGWYTTLAGQLVGDSGTVIAVEPLPDNVQLLLAAIERNGLTNTRVLPFAASDREGIVSVDSGGTSNASIVHPSHAGPESLLVSAIILDDWIERFGRIDVVKIDIEGHELAAIHGLQRCLERYSPTLFTEFSPIALRQTDGHDPKDYLDAVYARYSSVSIIPAIGEGLVACPRPQDVMDEWAKANDEWGCDGKRHLDLLATT